MVKDKVIKRDGSLVEFDRGRIYDALYFSYVDLGLKLDVDLNKITDNVISKIESTPISVEDIQNLVVNELLNINKDWGLAYQSYRVERNTKRNTESLENMYSKMKSVIEEGDDENSNKDYSLPSVKRDTVAGEFFRYDLKNNIPKKVYEAHEQGKLWWHDSDVNSALTNCCLANIEDMLENGTRITNADIEQPNSIQTAMNISTQIMASISSSQYGGVSFSNFNEVLSKYAKKNFKKNFEMLYNTKLRSKIFKLKKDINSNMRLNPFEKLIYGSSLKFAFEKTDKDIYDSCQLFEYQTSSVLGSASQTPFSTITFNIPTSWESERIIMNYLDVRQKGLGKRGTIALFPKLSMIVVDGYNLKETDPYYYILEEASKCIAKTYYPDILNYSKEDYDSGKYYGRMG